MDLTTARAISDTILADHSLTHLGWTFEFDRAEKRLGLCNYGTKTISMGNAFVLAADEDAIRQTMLHEIAHALAGNAAAHGPIWKAKAASIGYRGQRTASNPHSANERERKIEAAKAAAPLVAHLEAGPLRAGEHVTTRGFAAKRGVEYSGLVIETLRTYALLLDDRKGLIRIPLRTLFRTNSPGSTAAPAVLAVKNAVAAPLPVHRLPQAAQLPKGTPVVIDRPGSRYHGTRGTIVKVNAKSYSVETESYGRMTASRGLVRPA